MEVLARAHDCRMAWPTGMASPRDGALKEWPKDRSATAWQFKDLGGGYSTPSVAGGRLYVMTNKGLEDEFVTARNERTEPVVVDAYWQGRQPGPAAELSRRSLHAHRGRGNALCPRLRR